MIGTVGAGMVYVTGAETRQMQMGKGFLVAGARSGSREPFWWRLGVAGVRDEQCAHGINRVVLEFVQGIELQRWDEAGCRFMLWQNIFTCLQT